MLGQHHSQTFEMPDRSPGGTLPLDWLSPGGNWGSNPSGPVGGDRSENGSGLKNIRYRLRHRDDSPSHAGHTGRECVSKDISKLDDSRIVKPTSRIPPASTSNRRLALHNLFFCNGHRDSSSTVERSPNAETLVVCDDSKLSKARRNPHFAVCAHYGITG